MSMKITLAKISARAKASTVHSLVFVTGLAFGGTVLMTDTAFAMGAQPNFMTPVANSSAPAPATEVLPQVASPIFYVQGNVTYDLSRVYDAATRAQIIGCLDLGYKAMKAGGKNIRREITNLQGNGRAKIIRFFSNEQEASPGSVPTGAPATATWTGPNGPGDFTSPPSQRTDIRVYVNPGQPYWYLVNTIWHELLHTTLSVTHSQTTPEGTMPSNYVNDGIWYNTIRGIMLDFPLHAINPTTGKVETVYNTENSPWS